MSILNISNAPARPWKNTEKIILIFFFFYFIIQTIPLDWKFFREIFQTNWTQVNFYDLFRLTRYYPRFFGIEGFGNWGIAALVSVAATAFFTYRYNKQLNYDVLYYWLRVVLRYRLAIGIIAYGLIKLFPLQMPYPSLSNLHTNYGDFFPWKIYFHTLGIAQGYEVFLGGVEILAGILLLFRKTATFGSGIILGFTGNVLAANLAYDGGEQVYSAYLLVIALFLFIYDAPRLYKLLVQGKYTQANRFRPVFNESSIRTARKFLKSAIAFFILVLSMSTYANYTTHPYKYPSTPGLKGAYGFYNVREFVLNNKVIPYSTTDPDRWQNVVFEKWATISIKTAKPIKLDLSTGDEFHAADIDRNFESAGVGGRRYFSYQTDSIDHTILLQNKNKNHRSETYSLSYSMPNDSTIVLKGTNEKNDSVYAVLDRSTKKYLLNEGRRKRVKL
jgi:hypothetical protein